MAYAVVEKHIDAITTAVVRRRASLAELSVAVPDACGVVWNFIRASGIKGAGRNLAVYLDQEVTFECGVEIAAPFTGDGNVYCSATPSGLVARTEHFGPYHQLGQAHSAVVNWCRANNRAPAGPNWEIYGHWTEDVSRLQTDVFYLLNLPN